MASKPIKQKTMKKAFLFLAASILLVSCNANRSDNTIDDEAWLEVADSTTVTDVYAYEGNITAHGNIPAAHYIVVISEQLDSVNGTYTMTTTYIVADTVKNTPRKSHGKKFTHWGIPGDKKAKVYALAPDSGATDSVYLYVESDTTVVMLNPDKQKPTHPEHFRLKKK